MRALERIPKWKKKNDREKRQIEEMIKQTGPIYDEMTQRTSSNTKEDLLKFAEDRAKQMNLPRPNRSENRQKRALVLWICQFWPTFPQGLHPTSIAPQDPANSDEAAAPFDIWQGLSDLWERDFGSEDFFI
jgi:hypothetical protein